jgi:general L-amino acid transport system ATP-binding protein
MQEGLQDKTQEVMNQSAKAPMGEPMIIAEDVNKWYGNFHVLQGVSLTVHRGEVVVIMGPSGSGKSTFARTFNALEDYQSGSISIDGMKLGGRQGNIDAIRRGSGIEVRIFRIRAFD